MAGRNGVRRPVVTIRVRLMVLRRDDGWWHVEVVGFPDSFAVDRHKRTAIRKAKSNARRQFAEARVRAEKAYRDAGGRSR